MQIHPIAKAREFEGGRGEIAHSHMRLEFVAARSGFCGWALGLLLLTSIIDTG